MRTPPVMWFGRFAAGLFFLAFVVGQSPHLVHHLFDADETRTDCAFATAAERLPGLTTVVDDAPAEHPWKLVDETRRPPALTGRTLTSAGPRAPPTVAS